MSIEVTKSFPNNCIVEGDIINPEDPTYREIHAEKIEDKYFISQELMTEFNKIIKQAIRNAIKSHDLSKDNN